MCVRACVCVGGWGGAGCLEVGGGNYIDMRECAGGRRRIRTALFAEPLRYRPRLSNILGKQCKMTACSRKKKSLQGQRKKSMNFFFFF